MQRIVDKSLNKWKSKKERQQKEEEEGNIIDIHNDFSSKLDELTSQLPNVMNLGAGGARRNNLLPQKFATTKFNKAPVSL